LQGRAENNASWGDGQHSVAKTVERSECSKFILTMKGTKMNLDDLTIGEAKKLAELFAPGSNYIVAGIGCNAMIGKKCIFRSYASGVHYGELAEKDGKEVIIKNARRLWYWKTTNKGISLSEVALAGLAKDSKVCAPVDAIWLEAIEIIPCTKEAIKNIEAADEYKA